MAYYGRLCLGDSNDGKGGDHSEELHRLGDFEKMVLSETGTRKVDDSYTKQ